MTPGYKMFFILQRLLNLAFCAENWPRMCLMGRVKYKVGLDIYQMTLGVNNFK